VRYQQDLQVGLRDRYRRCVTAGFQTLIYEVRHLRQWIESSPALAGILSAAARAEPELDIESWWGSVNSRQGVGWPSKTEAGRAWLAWRLVCRMADDDSREDRSIAINYTHPLGTGGNLDDDCNNFCRVIVGPLIDYLTEQVGSESSVLYVLERYRRRIEWFDRQALYERYELDPSKGEALYDDDLRKFLFAEGIDMPFSQARSASGQSDVLSDLEGDDPLVCELKLFDANNRDRRHVVSGLQQAIAYAQDYGKNVAYLVVVNLSGRPLEFPTDGDAKVWPPFLDVAGVRTYLIAVRALPTASASKLGQVKPVSFAREDFVNPDA